MKESQIIKVVYLGPWSKGHEADDMGCLFFVDGKYRKIQPGEGFSVEKSALSFADDNFPPQEFFESVKNKYRFCIRP